ncbi:MAG TPA: transglycosylase family protein [Pseudonocardia sp.]|nr:transglycosylase family protein [Pseudonocardia sp.]
MSGRHRKPTKTAVRLARAGALTVMATAPLAMAGSAMASPLAPTDRDSTGWADHHSSSRADDSDWNGDDDWGDDDNSSRFSHADYKHSSDDDSSRSRSHSDDADSSDDNNNNDSDDSSSRKSSDEDSPSWYHAKHAARSSDWDDSDDSSTPSHARRHATPKASHGSSTRRHSAPVTPQAHDAQWDKLAQCESTENWDADTGNGYKGGLQFDDRTWRNYGGTEYAPTADHASRDEQIAVAKKVQEEQGWHAWPSCSRKLGYA